MNRLRTGVRQYGVTGSGLEMQAKFEGREGILSGNPWMAAAFQRAFVRR